MTMTVGNFRKQTRQFILLGVIAATAFAGIIAIVSSKTGSMALEFALEHSRSIAHRQGNAISSKLTEAMCTARVLANALESGMVDNQSIDRELFDRIFISTIKKSDEFFFGAWAVMKPGRLDGRDSEYAGKPGYGAAGDYVPFAYRENNGIVFKHDPFEGEKNKPYFTIPLAAERESIIEPYIDPTAGNAVMCSVTVPIFDKAGGAGVAGIDLLLSSINREIAAKKPFGAGFVFLIANTGFIVAHPRSDLVGRKISEFGAGPHVLKAVEEGREIEEERVDPDSGKLFHFVYVPMKVGNAATVWSVGVAIPRDIIMTKARSITIRTAFVGISSVILLAAMLFGIARSVIAPLRKSETAVRRAFDHVHDAVIIHSGEGRIIDANEQTLNLYGISRDKVSSITFRDDLSASDNPFHELPGIWKGVLAGNPGTFEWKARKPRTGKIFDVEIHLAALEMHGEKVIVATIHDLTERKHMELQILRSSKLESLGTLAGGIAHDFNNFLMGIYGNIALARNRAAGNENITTVLDRAEKAVTRASGLTKQLITFSKGGKPVKTFACLNELVKNSVLFSLSGSAMTPEFNLEPALWPAEVDEGQITQVITNIVINADQAKIGNGRLVLTTSNLFLEKPTAALSPGRYVKITISDNGPGISPENLSRIFDPYFSTKHGGTGLGLSTSYSIVKGHSGDIDVFSGHEKVTTFVILLPAGSLPAAPEKPTQSNKTKSDPPVSPDTRSAVRQTKLKVLLMDDDYMVLAPMAETLTELGFHVETACCGAMAVEKYKRALEEGPPFDAVVLDLVVPGGLGGVETLDRLKHLDPKVCAVISSGYCNQPVMSDFETHGFHGTLRKPYEFTDLIKAIDHCLAHRSDSECCR